MKLVPEAPLTDGRVTLRQWEESDAAFYARETGDAEIQRWTTEAAALSEEFVRETLARHRAHPRHAAFAITVAATDELAGNIALVSEDWSTGVAEASYWIAAAWRGRGFSSAALRLLCEWGFRELGLRQIELVTDPDNLPSRRTAEAGFAMDGTAPARKAGRPDLVLYSLLPPAKAPWASRRLAPAAG